MDKLVLVIFTYTVMQAKVQEYSICPKLSNKIGITAGLYSSINVCLEYLFSLKAFLLVAAQLNSLAILLMVFFLQGCTIESSFSFAISLDHERKCLACCHCQCIFV